MHLHFVFPIIAGLLYTIAALFSKHAINVGAGAMRITFIANFIAVIIFLPLLLLDTQILDPSLWWAPVVSGIANFAGMSLTFATIRVGDISIQTPLMGSKILIVAVLVTLIYSTPVPTPWWIAAFVAVVAIALLGKSRSANSDPTVILKTIILALLSSLSFAICDVFMGMEAEAFGEVMYLLIMISITAIASLAFLPFFRGGLTQIPKEAWRWIILGSVIMGLEELILYGAIAFYGNPTAMNILYSSRGIWSIFLIWTVGHWFKNTEKHAGGAMMRRRLIGAALLLVAIIIVLATEPTPEVEEICNTTCIITKSKGL